MKGGGKEARLRRPAPRDRAGSAGVIPLHVWERVAALEKWYQEQVRILHEDRRCIECAALGARYRREKAAILAGDAGPGRTGQLPLVPRDALSDGTAVPVCSFCGAALPEGAEGRGLHRLQRYCSRRCRNAAYYYRRRRRTERRKRLRRPKRRCVVCHKHLPPDSRTDRRTCSPRCRIALHRRKQLLGRDHAS